MTHRNQRAEQECITNEITECVFHLSLVVLQRLLFWLKCSKYVFVFSKLTPKQWHHVWVGETQFLTGQIKKSHTSPSGAAVFQMFGPLPYIKPHPVPSLLFPSNGKVVRSNMLPCFVELIYREHIQQDKRYSSICMLFSLLLILPSTLLLVQVIE